MHLAFTYNDVVSWQPWRRPLSLCAAVVLLCGGGAHAGAERVVVAGETSEVTLLAGELAGRRQSPTAILAALVERVRAVQAEPPRQADALRGYCEILDYLRAHRNQIQSPEQVLEQVVLRGIELGKRIGPSALTSVQKKQLARLYFAKGQLLFQAPRVAPQIAQEGYEAYQQALALDDDPLAPHRAEYLFRRDVALMILGRSDLEQFEEDARTASRIDPRHPGAHFLLGYVFYVRQGTAQVALQRIKLLQDAAQEFTRAIELLRTQDDVCNELPAYYEYRVNAWIKLSEFYTDERTRYLQNAAADAKEALERGPINRANAHAMHGTALETLAGSDQDRILEALEAFRQAADANPQAARYWIAQGRCECRLASLDPMRAAVHGGAALDLLARAQVGQAKGSPLTDAERAEVQYWRGQALLIDGHQDDRAEREFANASAVSNDKAKPWVALALEASAWLALDRAEKLGAHESARRKELLDHARARAESLRAFKHRERIVARIRGKALELEGKPLEALAEYDAELAREEKAQEVPDRILALQRLDLLLGNQRPALQPTRKADGEGAKPAGAEDGGS